MFIEEFKLPIDCKHNFISAVKLCNLCYFDALSVSYYLDSNYQFYRYIKVDSIFIFFFLSTRLPHLYIVLNTGSSFKAIEEYLTSEDLLERVAVEIKGVVGTITNQLEIYCIGHSAGGAYAYYVASLLKVKCITIGQLPLTLSTETELLKEECVQFIKANDLLCIHQGECVVDLDLNPPKDTLEGFINHSISSYVKLINDLLDLKEELGPTHDPVEISAF